MDREAWRAVIYGGRKESDTTEFIGRTDVEAETPIVWPPDAKN